jgi:hypothetical protein
MQAIALDGFYDEGKPLKKALSTIGRLGLLTPQEMNAMQVPYTTLTPNTTDNTTDNTTANPNVNE